LGDLNEHTVFKLEDFACRGVVPILRQSTEAVAEVAAAELTVDVVTETFTVSLSARAQASLVRMSKYIADAGTAEELKEWFHSHHNAPYPAYHDVEGSWKFPGFIFVLDRAQSDPFATPSKARVQVQHHEAKFPQCMYSSRIRRTALADYLLRTLHHQCITRGYAEKLGGHGWSGGKGGDIHVDTPGQQVLERAAVVVTDNGIEARFTIGLPARGRSIIGPFAAEVGALYLKNVKLTTVCSHVPNLVECALLFASHSEEALMTHITCVEDQEALRDQLAVHGLVGFVPNGARFPRMSGASDKPLQKNVVPFESPKTQAISLKLPNRGLITGMAIRKGAIYVCLGGGFHGKSTFLSALALGSYNFVPGDGREFVSTTESTASVQSEDGRPVSAVDISPFINNLPNGSDTTAFSTVNASGSTSCAAGLMEALELGAELLVFDEDTTASNFLVRDNTIAELVPQEPITPLVARAQHLVKSVGVTMVLICGASSAFLPSADVVVQMDAYQMVDVTTRAKEVCAAHHVEAAMAPDTPFEASRAPARTRRVLLSSLAPRGKMSTRTRTVIQHGDENIELHAVPQLVHVSQTRAIEALLRQWSEEQELLGMQGLGSDKAPTLCALVDTLATLIEQGGIDVLQSPGRIDGFLARPRRLDIGAARTCEYQQTDTVNRTRGAQFRRP